MNINQINGVDEPKINTKKYIENYLYIKTKDGESVPLRFNPPQQKLYDTIARQYSEGKPQRIIILKARQMGFSTVTESIIFKKTATTKNTKSGIITHLETATKNLFNMSKYFYNNLPKPLKPSILASNARELIFDTKDGSGLSSLIKCMTATDEGVGRSDTFQNLHISEFAFWKGNKNEIYSSLMQSVPNTINSMVIIESTANGFNEFKDMWDRAVAGESDFEPLFFAWYEMPSYQMEIRDKEEFNYYLSNDKEARELKSKYKLTDEQLNWRRWCIKNNCNGDILIFHQEYPSTPEEAFLSTGTGIFDNEQIVNRLGNLVPPVKVGYFTYDYDKVQIKNIKWVDDKNGAIKIYEEVKKGYPYVIGGDTAGDGSDYFIGQVIDNVKGTQVAVLRRQFDEDVYARQMYCLGMYYNKALIGLETNFSTFPIKELMRLEYPKLYVRMTEDTFTGKPKKSYGFRTDAVTRPLILGQLVEIVRDYAYLINDRTTLLEMQTFVRNEKGKPEALVGKHDDTIIALAIAYYIREQQSFQVESEALETVETWIEKAMKNRKGEGEGVLMEW